MNRSLEMLNIPCNEGAEEFLTIIAIGQKVLGSKIDYTKYFRMRFYND